MKRRLKAIGLATLGIALLVIPVIEWARFSYFDVLWPDIFYLAGRLASTVGFVMLFVQFVLSSRVRLIESNLGLDRLIAIHRLTGIAVLTMFLLHAFCLTVFELLLGYFSITPGKLLGAVALMAIIVVAGAALVWRARRWRYETWKRLHYLAYVVIPIGLLHALRLGSTVNGSTFLRVYYYVLTALYAILVTVKVLRRLGARRRRYTVAHVERENHDITSVYLEGPRVRHVAGQFLMINVATARGYTEAHPFTISSSPCEPRLRISAKAVGDFSAALRDIQVGTHAIIEAPYGAFSYVHVTGEPLVFIAGGIGITPFLSQLGLLRETGDPATVRLLWGNKTMEDLAFGDELAAFEREMQDFLVVHVLSDQSWEGETGFVDAALIRRHVHEIEDAEFFICGPPPMLASVRTALRQLDVSASHIHFERFSLG